MDWKKVVLILGLGFVVASVLSVAIPTIGAIVIVHEGVSVIEKMNLIEPDHAQGNQS